MIRITGIKVNIDHDKNDILKEASKILRKNIKDFKISAKSIDARKKEKALKTISFSKLFPYLCLFLLCLRKNEVENYADDGGKTDAGNGEGTG